MALVISDDAVAAMIGDEHDALPGLSHLGVGERTALGLPPGNGREPVSDEERAAGRVSHPGGHADAFLRDGIERPAS